MDSSNMKSLVLEGNINQDAYIEIVHSIFARGEDQLIALRDVIEERANQDRIHGVSSQRQNMTEQTWLSLILTEASPNGVGDGFRHQMVKITAIGLAAIEAHDGRKHRGDNSPGV